MNQPVQVTVEPSNGHSPSRLVHLVMGDKQHVDTLDPLDRFQRREFLDGAAAALGVERTLLHAVEVRIVELAAEKWPEQPGGDDSSEHFTDLGNARRLATQHAGLVRFCHPTKDWLVWDGTRYAPDETGAILRVCKTTVGRIWQDAQGEPDAKRRGLLAGHAARSEAAARIHAMIGLAQSEPGVPILPAEMDRDPFLLNCPNGTIDLRTGKLRPHNQTDVLTKLCPTPYAPDATCPLWEGAVLRHMDGNTALVAFLQRLYGYCLTGDISEEIFAIFHGEGQNGKSLQLNAVRAVMGADYSLGLTTEFLMVKKYPEHPTEKMDLMGRRLCIAIETEDGQRLSEALVKHLTGKDPIKARHLYSDMVEFLPTHKIVLACNYRPHVKGQEFAVWRRIRLVPFSVTIPPAERDKQLPDKLLAESPGILAWLVRGCLAWQREGLGEPPDVLDATDAYKADEDTLGVFLKECCIVGLGNKCPATPIYNAYLRFSGDKEITQTRFGRLLTRRGFDRARIDRVVYRLGLTLADDEPQENQTGFEFQNHEGEVP